LIKLEEWPKDKVPKGAITKLDDVENRRPKARIFAGSPILENQLLGKGVLDQGASDAIPKGMRVIAVKVNDVSGGASLIRPGDRVDVLVHVQRAGGSMGQTITKTILQDIKVFAVDNVWDVATGGEKAVVARTISLLVTPAQAEKVTMACEMGTIRLVMRSPDDKAQVAVNGTRASDVFEGEAGGVDRVLTLAAPPGSSTTKNKSSAVAGLLGLLSKHKKKQGGTSGTPLTPPPEPKKPEVFTVRVLAGSQLTDTVLESTGDDQSSVVSDHSFLHWRQSSSLPTVPLSPRPDRPAAKSSDDSQADDPASEDEADDSTGKPNEKSAEGATGKPNKKSADSPTDKPNRKSEDDSPGKPNKKSADG
jgi:pilus assembly protein CpaB